MELNERKIEYYRTLSLKKPFIEWFNSLKDLHGRAIVRAKIERIRFGNFSNCKPVGSGVYEIIINYGPGYRVYFGQVGLKIVVLLCGGDKDSQNRDIKKAKEYWIDYRRRKNAKDQK